MPKQDHKKNARWTIDTLREEPSLVYSDRLWLDGFLSESKSGLLAPVKVKELLTGEYDEQLRPGLFSETGKKWLAENKGSHVALLVAQCP